MCGVAIRLADLSPIPAAVVQPLYRDERLIDCEIVDANDGAHPIFRAGVPGSAIGYTLRQLMPWIDESGVWAIYEEVATAGRPVSRRNFELRIPDDAASTTVPATSVWDITAMPLGQQVLVFFVDVTADWRRVRQREEDVAQARALAERTRMARDLHDTVIQDVLGASMGLNRLVSTSSADVAERLKAIVDIHDNVVRHLRTVLFELRQSPQRDLADQIRQVVAQAAVALEFDPTLTLGSLASATEGAVVGDHVLNMLREILSNVARHAHAHRVDVDVHEANGWLTLSVSDDGVGIAPDAVRGSGLANLEERTRLLGGMSFTETSPATGTRVVCELPVEVATIAPTHHL